MLIVNEADVLLQLAGAEGEQIPATFSPLTDILSERGSVRHSHAGFLHLPDTTRIPTASTKCP